MLQTMDAKPKTRTSRKSVFLPTNTTSTRCFVLSNCSSSKRTGEATLTCTGCKQEFLVPSATTTYRCYKCQGVSYSFSRYEQSREDGGSKLFKHDQLNNANANGVLLSRLSPSIGSSSPLSTDRNKRAVLCGVIYRNRKFKLEGTINDIVNMQSLLVDKFKFPIECIRVLTEEQDPNLFPTKKNILESLRWLVRDCESGDSLVFYFSGHGLQQTEYHKGEELDGLDETICPVDFMQEGTITDNEINSTIVQPLKKGVKLHAILDTCHSGTALDLAYVYNKENWKWKDNKPGSKNPIVKHTSGGLAVCLSACEDGQMAADTAAFGGKGTNGVMTYLFSKVIKENSELTYGLLLEKINDEIGRIHQSKFYNSFLKRIFNRKVDQDPVLSSSAKFDVSKKIFKL
ncbi:metacaspase-1-like isoform X2 [Abrus precatorius]|uniref:Metacaspase-1-like isoform X2 n=1 Tax=Abrus precatorius TaxID=3816 RepID=A0A8B8K7B4_ABRPR|nr:metacaspase-1-like isoform X2 [Abrus precatorius]